MELTGHYTLSIDETINLLLDIMDVHHPGLKARSFRIAKTCSFMAQVLGEKAENNYLLQASAKLSQLKYLFVDCVILNKPLETLSKQEQRQLSKAAKKALRILKSYPQLNDIAEYIFHQQDNFAGKTGLTGKDIPIVSRILAAVAKFDLLIHPFHNALPCSINLATKKMLNDSKELDPDMVNIFVNNILPEYGYEKTDEVPLNLTQVKQGMVLTRAIRDDYGEKLLKAGTKLSQELLDLLQEVEELNHPTSLLYLSRNSVTPHNSCPAPTLPVPIIKRQQDIDNKVIIVVDDESGIVNTIKWQLKRAKYNVIGFTDPLL